MFQMELNENFDFIKTCRLCLSENDLNALISIFDMSGFELTYSLMVSECTGVTITKDDVLPKNICIECMKRLNNFYQFKKLVVNSAFRLDDFLNKLRNKLVKDQFIQNTDNIKVENLDPDFDEEANIPISAIKIETNPYVSEDIAEFESKIDIIKEKLKVGKEDETSLEPAFTMSNSKQDNYLGNNPISNEDCVTSRVFNKSHKREKIFSCNDCGKTFTQIVDLRIHERIHTGERLYNCKECGKCFTQLCYVRAHERIHTGEKPYNCNQCGKSFIDWVHLKRHKRNHSGERPFSCTHCTKRFIQSSHLKEHLRIHTGEKPYGCEECGKAFSRSHHLSRHILLHESKKNNH